MNPLEKLQHQEMYHVRFTTKTLHPLTARNIKYISSTIYRDIESIIIQ